MFDDEHKTKAALALIFGLVSTLVVVGLDVHAIHQSREGLTIGPKLTYTLVVTFGGVGVMGFGGALALQAFGKIGVARWWCAAFAVVGFGLSFGLGAAPIIGTILFTWASYHLQTHLSVHGIDIEEGDEP